MKREDIELRRATRDDYVELYGHNPPHSFRGLVAVARGRVMGIAGVMYSNPLQAFSLMNEELRRYPRFLVEHARRLHEILESVHADVYAVANQDLDSAPRFLKWAGFEPTGRMNSYIYKGGYNGRRS